MSSDSSHPAPTTSPIDMAVEGLVLRPEAFDSPSAEPSDDSTNVLVAHAAAAREFGDRELTGAKSFPLWALVPIVGLCLTAGTFLNGMTTNPNLKGYSYTLTPPDGEASGGGAPVDEYDPKIWLAKGKAEYATVCASCHQPTGEGVAGQYPPLKASEYVIHGEERVVAILLHGIVGQLQVNGKGYNGQMPAQGALKNNKAIAQIASYIRHEWGNQASMIYDDQVAELRKKLSTRTAPYVEADLKAIPQDANLTPSKHGGAPAAAVPVTTAPPAAPAAAPASAAAAPTK